VGKEGTRNEDETDKFISCRNHTDMSHINGKAHNSQRHVERIQTSKEGCEIFNGFLHITVAGK